MKKAAYFVCALVAVLIASCSKNSNITNPPAEKNIVHTTPNTVFQGVLDSGDPCDQTYKVTQATTVYGLQLHVYLKCCATDTILSFDGTANRVGGVLIDELVLYVDGIHGLQPMSSSTEISTLPDTYSVNSDAYYNTSSKFNIKPGSGDKYIAFKYKNFDQGYSNYGWMLINYASNGRSVTLKEVAYNAVKNGAIKVGEL